MEAERPEDGRVKNGRVVVDEPTDLPDGAEVEVLVIGGDELTPEERVELHASLDRALENSDAGRGVDAWEYLKQCRPERHLVEIHSIWGARRRRDPKL